MLWWAHVTVTPLAKRIIVLRRGTEYMERGEIPLGGQSIPISTTGAKEASKKAQKKRDKKENFRKNKKQHTKANSSFQLMRVIPNNSFSNNILPSHKRD